MGMAGIVITTDAPPMNELVAPGRGLLVAYNRTSRQGLGTNYHASVGSIEVAMERALAMTMDEKEQLRQRAREWFVSNDRAFRDALPRVAAELMAGGVDL